MENGKNRWVSLFVLAFMPFMGTLDANIVNVALPTIAKDLDTNMASVEWIVTIYLIAICSTIIIFGRLGDTKGKVRIFKIGLLLFTVGSLLCGVAGSLPFLIFARLLQSVGAACAMATNQGIITHIFPKHERGRALGISAMAVALGTMTGAPLGGLILSISSWHVIFLINIPIGIVAVILAVKFLPKEHVASHERLDIPGAVLYFVSIASLLVTLNVSHYVSNQLYMLTGYAGSIGLLVLFVFVERRTKNPLLDLSIFKNGLFSLSIFCSFISFVAISSLNIIQPFYLQDILGLSVGATGLFMMIFPIVSSAVAPLSGYMSDKIGSEVLTFVGLLIAAIGLFGYSALSETTSLVIIGLFCALASLGNSLFQTPNTSLVMSTVPPNKLGVAGSLNALVRNLGMTIGILLSTSVLYHQMSAELGYEVLGYVEGEAAAFIFGMHWAYLVAGSICVLGALLTGIRLRNNRARRMRQESAGAGE